MPVLLIVVGVLVAPELFGHHLGHDEGECLGVLGPAAIWSAYRTWLLVDAQATDRTVSDYRWLLWDFFALCEANGKPWHKATRHDLQQLLDRPARTGRTKGQPLAPNTRLQYASGIKAFYGWCHLHEFISRNPMAKVKLPRGGIPVARAFSMWELRQILIAAEHDPRLYVACWLGYGAGCRCGEIAALRIQDVYLDHRHPHLLVHGKGRKQRLIPLYPEVRSAIVRVLSDRGHPRVGPLLVAQGTRPGGAMTPASVSRLLSRHIRGLGIDGSGHGLRHSFTAELLEAAGEERLYTISKLLGHADTSVTEKVYALSYRGEPEQVLQQLPDPTRRKATR